MPELGSILRRPSPEYVAEGLDSIGDDRAEDLFACRGDRDSECPPVQRILKPSDVADAFQLLEVAAHGRKIESGDRGQVGRSQGSDETDLVEQRDTCGVNGVLSLKAPRVRSDVVHGRDQSREFVCRGRGYPLGCGRTLSCL